MILRNLPCVSLPQYSLIILVFEVIHFFSGKDWGDSNNRLLLKDSTTTMDMSGLLEGFHDNGNDSKWTWEAQNLTYSQAGWSSPLHSAPTKLAGNLFSRHDPPKKNMVFIFLIRSNFSKVIGWGFDTIKEAFENSKSRDKGKLSRRKWDGNPNEMHYSDGHIRMWSSTQCHDIDSKSFFFLISWENLNYYF